MNKPRMILFLPALAVLTLSLSSCNGFWIALGFGTGTPDVSGKIVNAGPYGTSFSGATVTLQNIDKGTTYTATVDSSGNWSVDSIKAGHYTASASFYSNYFFTSLTAPFSYSGSGSITAPTIGGLYTGNLYQTPVGYRPYSYIVFILMWNNSQQLNLHLTGPNANYGSTSTNIFMDSPNYSPSDDSDPSASTFLSAWQNGFGPNGGYSSGSFTQNGRLHVYSLSPSISSGGSTDVVLTTAASGYGPDAITLFSYFTTTGFAVSPNYYNSLPSKTTTWDGVLELYIDAPGSYLSTPSATTNATLYAVQANPDGSPDVLGVSTIPTNAYVATVAALRINIMDSVFQLVPQMTLVAPSTFRSANAASDSGVVSVPRGPVPK